MKLAQAGYIQQTFTIITVPQPLLLSQVTALYKVHEIELEIPPQHLALSTEHTSTFARH